MYVGYRYYVGDLRTGKIHRQVDLGDSRWMTSFDYGVPGTVEGSFPLRDVNTDSNQPSWLTARADTAPGKSYLAVSYTDDLGTETFLEGGPIWVPPAYDAETGIMQFGAAGLSTYYDHVKPITVPLGSTMEEVPSSFIAGLAFGLRGSDIAPVIRYLINLGTDAEFVTWVPIAFDELDPMGDLVLDVGSEVDTATHQYLLVVRWFELPWTGALLKKITEEEGGPEIQFVPRRKASDPRYLEWVVQIGDPMLTQAGPAWQFDYSVRESHVRDIDISPGSTSIASRMWAAGEGEAEGRPIVFVDDLKLTDLGWPLLEGEVTASDTEANQSKLLSYATEDLAKASKTSEAWTVTVSRDGSPNVGQYRKGDWARLRVRGHHYIPDGDYDMRILAISGNSGSEDVVLTMSERLA